MAKEFIQKHFIDEAKAAINHWSGVGGSSGSGGSGSAPSENVVEIDILSRTKFSSFKSNSMLFGAMTDVTYVDFQLTIGETYFVEWDGEIYKSIANDASTFNAGSILLGNGSLINIPSNDEPFAIALTGKQLMLVSVDPDKTEHDVRVYQTYTSEDAVLLHDKAVTENGTYTANEGYDGLRKISVEVPIPTPELQDKTITENGTYTADEGYDGLGAVTVSVATSGGGGSSRPEIDPVEDDIIFYDYDGTMLYGYSKEEIASMSELPPLPEREGLVCQGWNYTLEDLKSVEDMADVGAIYTTDDGSTRMHLNVSTVGQSVLTCFKQSVANGVAVDWGDGSEVYRHGTAGNVRINHTYSTCGKYTISLKPDPGCTLTLGYSGSEFINNGYVYEVNLGSGAVCYSLFYRPYGLEYITIPKDIAFASESTISFYDYFKCLKHVSIPEVVTVVYSSNLYALESISLPKGCSTGGFNYSFKLRRGCSRGSSSAISYTNCYSLLRAVSKPSTKGGSAGFDNCHNLKRVFMPSTNLSIGAYSFRYCYSLENLKIPPSVTSIGDGAFYDMYNCLTFDFSDFTAVPTLSGTSGISSSARFLVPASLYSEWIAAANWSKIASQIIAV